MVIPRILNMLGLSLSTIGAFLLLIVPFSTLSYDKVSKRYQVSTMIAYKVTIPPWKVWLPRYGGPVLLAIGFLLQLAAELLGA